MEVLADSFFKNQAQVRISLELHCCVNVPKRKPSKDQDDRKRTGTPSLREHITNCEKDEKDDEISFEKQAKLSGYFQTTWKNLSDAEKCKINPALSTYVACDMHPFKSVEDN